MRLILFDLDNTLLNGDSDFAWSQYLIEQGVLDRALYEAQNLEFYRQYQAGTLDIRRFLAFQLQPLAAHPRAELDRWHAEFMRQKIMPMVSEAARALVRGHAGRREDLLAVVTATNSFVTAPIVRELGIPHLIATEPEEVNGAFTGGVRGEPCFQAGKVTRLGEWLAGRGLTWEDFRETWFYSDSYNDLPLLSQVSRPVAVDPDERLLVHARAHGWPVMSLRQG